MEDRGKARIFLQEETETEPSRTPREQLARSSSSKPIGGHWSLQWQWHLQTEQDLVQKRERKKRKKKKEKEKEGKRKRKMKKKKKRKEIDIFN